MLRERSPQALEVTRAERHRATPRNTARRVREANDSLALLGLQQLDDGREALFARSLRKCQLLDRDGWAPGSCACLPLRRHVRQRIGRSLSSP